jgi:serine/threonine protein kinase
MRTTLKKSIVFETTFSKYIASVLLGEGGAGRVYEAVDDSEQPCAIKVLDHSKRSRDNAKRFKNELFFCLKNRHPNIVTVQDHGIQRGDNASSPFYVMPLYRQSLRQLMVAGIGADKAPIYFSQLLDGVEAAHLQKVVHRDLKPENILHDAHNDRLLIADFGIAQFSEEQLYTSIETAPGARLANFLYAAPEQRVRGNPVDHRADIFALGLMLNELFTGTVPQGTNYKTIGSVAPQYSYLDETVAAMIAQSPSERPASIEVVKLQLIARKADYVARQRLSETWKTVVPTSEIDDPLVLDPVRLIGFDWDKGMLTLVLSQPVNDRWVDSLVNMGSHTAVMGKGPERFKFNLNKANIETSEHDAQRVIDYFKEWLTFATRKYEQTIRQEKAERERKLREQLQRQLEEQERRIRVLSKLKI